jgi:hypothetical protein
MVTKNRNSFGTNCGAKNFGILLRILQNVIEKSFINWRVLSLVKINTRISETPCMVYTGCIQKHCFFYKNRTQNEKQTLKHKLYVKFGNNDSDRIHKLHPEDKQNFCQSILDLIFI